MNKTLQDVENLSRIRALAAKAAVSRDLLEQVPEIDRVIQHIPLQTFQNMYDEIDEAEEIDEETIEEIKRFLEDQLRYDRDNDE